MTVASKGPGVGSIVAVPPLARSDQPSWQVPGPAVPRGSVRQRCGCREPDTGRQLGAFCPRLADPAHGSWSIDVTVPGPFGVGPPVRVRSGGHPTRQAAQSALDRVVGRAHTDAAGAAWTVQRWLTHWLATHPRIRPATRSSYESHVRGHLAPTLGRYRLDELTPPVVQTAFTRIAATRTRTGQPLSAATVRRVHATLRAALNAALRDGLLVTNPARHTRLPLAQPVHPEVWTPGRVAIWRATGEHPTVAVWTPDQLAEFLHHRRQAGDPLYPAWRLISLRGLRRGEACGLRWADLDLDPEHEQATGQLAGGHGRLRVVQAMVQIGGRVSPAPPKTPASRRTISLDPATTTLLRNLRAAAVTRAGGRLDPTAPVLVDHAGRPIQPQRLTVAFRRAVAATGLPPVRLHDLRHGAASLALAAGADLKTVQDLLGHSTIIIITTADIYTSVLPEVHDRYADAVADLVQAAQQRHPPPSVLSAAAVTESWSQGTPASHLRNTHVTPGLGDPATTASPALFAQVKTVGPVGLEPTLRD